MFAVVARVQNDCGQLHVVWHVVKRVQFDTYGRESVMVFVTGSGVVQGGRVAGFPQEQVMPR